MKKLSWGRRPLVACVQPELPGYFTTPGRRSSRFSKFRPFNGRSLITWLLSDPPSSALVVFRAAASAVTVTVSVCSPVCIATSTRRSCAHLEQNVLAIGILKALEFDVDVVGAGDQIGSGVGIRRSPSSRCAKHFAARP